MIKINNKNAQKVEELRAHIDFQFNKAQDGRDDKSTRFTQSYRYFLGMEPQQNMESEVSAYVEPVMRKTVDSVKPSIMNIFTENEKKAVAFRPTVLVDAVRAGLVDDAVNNVFLRDNDGYDVVEKAVTETLVTGDSFLKVYVESETIVEDFTAQGNTMEELAMLAQSFPDTDFSKLDQVSKTVTDPQSGEEFEVVLFEGEVELKRIESKIRVEMVPFSDLFIDGSCEDIADTRYICHRLKKTVGELLDMGYDADKIASANSVRSDDDDCHLSTEKLVNDGVFSARGDDDYLGDPNEREVYLYEHYIYSSLFDRKGKSKLYQVMATSNDVLAIEEVSFIPFVHGQMERIPGSFWGRSIYDRTKQAQDSISRSIRVIELNAQVSTYNRYAAVKGQYDRASLLNNRPGAVIEVENPASLSFFPQPQLPASLGEMLNRVTTTYKEDMMSAVGVDVTGANMSATAAAITANSADLKDKIIAKTLAYTLFRPLFELIYEIIRAEDMPVFTDPQSGQVVTGSQLPKSGSFQIDVNTANDDSVLSQQLVQLCSLFAQWSQVQSPILGVETMYNVAEKVTGLSQEEVRALMPTPPQPSPEEQQAQAMEMEKQKVLAEETAHWNKELAKTQALAGAAMVAKTEQETIELIKDGEAKRLMDKDESMRKFVKLDLDKKKMELAEAELIFEMENPEVKIQNSFG